MHGCDNTPVHWTCVQTLIQCGCWPSAEVVTAEGIDVFKGLPDKMKCEIVSELTSWDQKIYRRDPEAWMFINRKPVDYEKQV